MPYALILEDDACSALALSALLDQAGIQSATVADTNEAILALEERAPDLLIADWNVLGDVSSVEIARRVRVRRPDARIVFISGFSRDDIEEAASSVAPCSIYVKPLNFDAFFGDIEGSVAAFPKSQEGRSPAVGA